MPSERILLDENSLEHFQTYETSSLPFKIRGYLSSIAEAVLDISLAGVGYVCVLESTRLDSELWLFDFGYPRRFVIHGYEQQ